MTSRPPGSACNLDDPATWQYETDPFCEPQQIPGTPNISVGMEQFNDTPIVNGVAYPTITLEPKTYRFRMLNAANDRFFNFQWYVGDPTTASTGLNSGRPGHRRDRSRAERGRGGRCADRPGRLPDAGPSQRQPGRT